MTQTSCQFSGWKALVYYSRNKTQENWEGQTNTKNLTEDKKRKRIHIYYHRHDDSNEEIIAIHNTDEYETECHAYGLKGHKVKECQTKQISTL